MTWPMKICLYLCVGLLMQIAFALEQHVACQTDQPKKSLLLLAVIWPAVLTLSVIASVVTEGDDFRCEQDQKAPSP